MTDLIILHKELESILYWFINYITTKYLFYNVFYLETKPLKTKEMVLLVLRGLVSK